VVEKRLDPLAAALIAALGGGAQILGLTERDVAYLDQVLLDERGLVRVLPAAELAKLEPKHLRSWLHFHAVYVLPSAELVAWLRDKIAGRRAIEIGAGNGAIGRALGIPRTDNKSQLWPDVAAYYRAARQPTIRYPDDVEQLDAHAAIAKYRPEVVIACYVTHRYREDEPDRAGNMYGPDEDLVIDSTRCYVHVGTTTAHANKRILARPHSELRADWLFSRGVPEERVIWVWGE
jgi:hypothetical protein